MDGVAWCALANKTHPEMVRQVHESYIRAGADIVTANTFSTSRTILGPVGLGDEVAAINQRAVALALEARDNVAGGRPVAVAGSMSIMTPFIPGTYREDPAQAPDEDAEMANHREMAGLLAGAGVDLIVMEMMYDTAAAKRAVTVAVETGLPVWVGLSVERGPGGALTGWERPDVSLDNLLDGLLPLGGAVAGIMHTTAEDTDPALDALFARWDGPVMAYPESLVFTPAPGGAVEPDFAAAIPEDAFAERCRGWVEHGVQIIGGCCGISIDHMTRMYETVPRRVGPRR
jgi:methionine synthase I (cobalamin-dependent)